MDTSRPAGEQFAAIEQVETKNGALRVYGVDEHGKKTPLKHDDILTSYGYVDRASDPDAVTLTDNQLIKRSYHNVVLNDLSKKEEKNIERQSGLQERLDDTDPDQRLNRVGRLTAKLELFGRKKLSNLRQKRIGSLESKLAPPRHNNEAVELRGGVWNRFVTGLGFEGKENFQVRTHEEFTSDGELNPQEWLDAARDDLARLNARNRFSLFGRHKQALAKARENYQQAFSMYVASEMLELQQEGEFDEEGNLIQEPFEFDPEEFKEAALVFSIEEIRERTVLEAKYAAESRKGRFLAWYNSLTTAKKIALGGGVGLVAGAVALIAGGAVAAGAIASGKFIRTKTQREGRAFGSKENDQESRSAKEVNYLEEKLQSTDLQVDLAQDFETNNDRRAQAVANTILGAADDTLRRDRREVRKGVAIGGSALIGGYVVGKLLNATDFKDHLPGNKGKSDIPGGRPGARGLSDPAVRDALGGSIGTGVEDVTPVFTPQSTGELVSVIRPGSGLLENLQTGFGLNPQQAAEAMRLMDEENLLDGKHINGVIKKGSKVVMYVRGQGDGAMHYTGRAAEIINSIRSGGNGSLPATL